MPDLKPRVTVGSSSSWARRDLERHRSNAIITSPYLTSPAAEAVIGRADPETAVVLTTFNAATFAAGGSSLRTIRKLMALDYKLRALDGLHAKLVVTEGTVLVGSQNLTAAGTRNREATARVSDPSEVARVREGVAPWIAASQPITAEMVDHMEGLVGRLRELAADLKAFCAVADAEVGKAEEERERQRRKTEEELKRQRQKMEERRRTAAERARLRRAASREGATLLRTAVEAAPLLGSVPMRLALLDSLSQGNAWGEKYWTLLALGGADIKQLALLHDSSLPEEPRPRYLLVAPATGRLGWLALQKTRLTNFGTEILNKGRVTLDDMVFDVDVEANQNPRTLANWNIKFSLGRPGSPEPLVVRGVFSLDGFKVRHVGAGRGEGPRRSAVRERLMEAGGDLALQLCTVALEPFVYDRNGRADISTDRFCDGLGRDVVLKLRRHAGKPFYSLE